VICPSLPHNPRAARRRARPRWCVDRAADAPTKIRSSHSRTSFLRARGFRDRNSAIGIPIEYAGVLAGIPRPTGQLRRQDNSSLTHRVTQPQDLPICRSCTTQFVTTHSSVRLPTITAISRSVGTLWAPKRLALILSPTPGQRIRSLV